MNIFKRRVKEIKKAVNNSTAGKAKNKQVSKKNTK